MYQQYLLLADAGRDGAMLQLYPYDIAPATDDRPFFFRYSYWWHLFPASGMVWVGSLAEMEYSTTVLFLMIGAAALVTIYWPLRFVYKGARDRSRTRYGLFFGAIGLGYMAV